MHRCVLLTIVIIVLFKFVSFQKKEIAKIDVLAVQLLNAIQKIGYLSIGRFGGYGWTRTTDLSIMSAAL